MYLKKIAVVHTDFSEKFGIPRQSGLVPAKGRIVFEPEYRSPAASRKGMAADGAAPAFGREPADGGICY